MDITSDRVSWVRAEIDRMVDEYRLSCLWYLPRDFYPRTDAERVRALETIERHGDLAAFRLARQLREWLSPPSSDPSAAS